MSRNTKMKSIAAEGIADHYCHEEQEYNSEDEELIDEVTHYYKGKFTRKEVIRVLEKNDWYEEETYSTLDELLAKKEAKIANEKKPKQQSEQPSGQAQSQQIGNKLTKKEDINKGDQKQNVKEDNKNQHNNHKEEAEEHKEGPMLKMVKQQSNSCGVQAQKTGEYMKIDRDLVKFNGGYPEITYDLSGDQDSKENRNLNLVIVGHVDSGKSTLIGHLCQLKSVIDQRQAHKNEKDSKNMGKESFKFAWVNDEFEAERARGVTIDIGYKVIKTKNKVITFLDAPGHKDFVPNMIQGVTQADYALLVIEGTSPSFERGFEFGGQTKEHAFLVKELGVSRLIILINKMDLVKWNQDRYNHIKTQLIKFLLTIGYSEDNLIFIPISAFYAENIVDKTTIPEASWYEGNCLMDSLDQLVVPERKITTPLRLNIYNSFFMKNKGLVVQGKVEGGVIYEKSKALIMPQGLIVTVKEISRDGLKVKQAKIGENIDVAISHKEDCEVKSGDVLCSIEYPIPIAKGFILQLCAFELTYPILKGTQIVMYINTSRCPGIIRRISAIIDKTTGEVIKKNPKCIRDHEYSLVEVAIDKEHCMELYNNFKSFGRVVIREKMSTLGVGKIVKIC